MTELTTNQTTPADLEPGTSAQDVSPQMVSAVPSMVAQAQIQIPHTPAWTAWRRPRIQRSNSDPVLLDLAAKVLSSDSPLAPSPQTTDSSTQTSQPTLAAHTHGQVTLRRGNSGARARRRPRPSSMVDYQSYRHTQQLVRRILDQPAAEGLAPEVQELVDSIRNVLQSDQEHMEEAVRCASYIEQVFTESEMAHGQRGPPPPQQQPGGSSQTFPRLPRRRPGLLHLQSCGDLSSFTCSALELPQRPGSSLKRGSRGASRAGSRTDHPERPHSLIGVFRETVL
ncbi:hypothetical protein LDENG_00275850 [Lucifuga dentata]|nr:hypothetical protein LDENG_00275850 [Lucifuga dentata]